MKKASFLKKKSLTYKLLTLLAFLLVWGLFIYMTFNAYQNTLGMESIGNSSGDQVTQLHSSVRLSQTMFTVDNAESISIRFATYARRNSGTVNIRVTGADSGKVYADENIDVTTIQDNSYLTVSLDEPLMITKDSHINVELSSDSEFGKAVGVYYSAYDVLEDSVFTYNGFEYNGDLSLKQLVRNEFYQRFTAYVIIYSAAAFTIIIILTALNVPKEILFCVIVLLCGLVYTAIMTPMSVPDEQFHYESAYQITSYIFGEDHRLMDLTYRNYSHFNGHSNAPGAYKRLLEHWNDPLEMREKYEEVAIDIDILQYLVYFLPQTVGVFIGRVLKLNFLKTFYLGRFTNMLFFIACVYIALKKTPVLKTLLGLLCCTPIFIQQCASYSYDSFVNGLCLIIVAYFLKWYHTDEKITRREIIIVFLTILGLAPAKKVYGLFMLPFIFIPESRFGSRKNKLLTLLIISAPAVYITVQMLTPPILRIFNRIRHDYLYDENNPLIQYAGPQLKLGPLKPLADADPSTYEDKIYSVGFIVENPIYTMKLIYRTIRYSIKKWFYDSLGRTLSGVSLILPLRLVHLLSACIIAAALIKEDFVLPIKVKGVIILMCIAIAMMIIMGFLLTWTNRLDTMIQGVQGRYFSPLLPYFFSVFSNKYVKIPQKAGTFLIYGHLLMLFYTIIYVLSFTFVS